MTWIVSQRRILFEQKILKRSRRKKKVVSKEFDAFYGKQLFFGGAILRKSRKDWI